MTPNQVVAYNVAKARALRGWTQEHAATALAPFLGTRLSAASFSALERSAWNTKRIKVFSADDLVALARGFDLPMFFFLVPPPPADGILLSTPAAGEAGEDPVVMLDAMLGSSENQVYLEKALLASCAPPSPTAHGPGSGVSMDAQTRRVMTEALARMRTWTERDAAELQASLKLAAQFLGQMRWDCVSDP
jgi:hypothetical protein